MSDLASLYTTRAAFDRDDAFARLEPLVCYDRAREQGKPYRVKVSDQSTSVTLAEQEHARLAPLLALGAKALEELERVEQFLCDHKVYKGEHGEHMRILEFQQVSALLSTARTLLEAP